MSEPANRGQDAGADGTPPAGRATGATGSSGYGGGTPGDGQSGSTPQYGSTPPYGSTPQYGSQQYGSAPGQYGAGPQYGQPAGSTPAHDTAEQPAPPPAPVAVRRPDPLAALLLLLAGIAAAVSLIATWLPGRDTGLELVQTGLTDLGDSVDRVRDSGSWQPVVIVLGGAVLFVLGVLALLPARKRRFLGLFALLVSAAVVTALLIPLGAEGWDLGVFDVGFYAALAVGALGLLGSLKMLLTGKKYRTAEPAS